MRILHVYMGPYVANRGGGVSIYVRNIAERLAKRHDVTVFATNIGGLPRYEVVNRVRVERFNCIAPGRAYFFSMDMLLRLRKVEFDVVHGHCYHAFPMHFSTLAKCKKLVLSTHFHGVGHSIFRNSLVRLLKPLGRRTLEKADKIIAVSEYEKNLLMEQFKLDFDKIAVIPAGVDFNDFKGLKRHERNFRSILYVGRLVEYKGVQYLVEVLPMLPNDVILEIVGKGPLRPYLEKRAKALGVFERVRFYQNLPRRELLQKYVDADVFVLLSRYEAYSITVAEALVAGTPCIVAKASALTEWIDNKICFGINLPINLKCLTGLIIKVLERAPPKPVTKNMFGNKIVEWDNVTEQLESIYLQ